MEVFLGVKKRGREYKKKKKEEKKGKCKFLIMSEVKPFVPRDKVDRTLLSLLSFGCFLSIKRKRGDVAIKYFNRTFRHCKTGDSLAIVYPAIDIAIMQF